MFDGDTKEREQNENDVSAFMNNTSKYMSKKEANKISEKTVC